MTSSRGDSWWDFYCDESNNRYELYDLPGVYITEYEYQRLHDEWTSRYGRTTQGMYDELNAWFIENLIPDPFKDMVEVWQ